MVRMRIAAQESRDRHPGGLEQGQRVLILGAEASKYLFGGFVYTH